MIAVQPVVRKLISKSFECLLAARAELDHRTPCLGLAFEVLNEGDECDRRRGGGVGGCQQLQERGHELAVGKICPMEGTHLHVVATLAVDKFSKTRRVARNAFGIRRTAHSSSAPNSCPSASLSAHLCLSFRTVQSYLLSSSPARMGFSADLPAPARAQVKVLTRRTRLAGTLLLRDCSSPPFLPLSTVHRRTGTSDLVAHLRH